MATDNNLEEELKERLHTRRLDKLTASMSGACISKAHCYSIDSGDNIFVKTNGTLNARVMFDGELEGLKQIEATKTIKVPKPLTVMHDFDGRQNCALVMEFLDIVPLSGALAKSLGQNLANLHDYNSKLIKFNQRAARWVGRQIPSVKHATNLQADGKNPEDQPDEAEGQEENQFTKHNIRIRPDEQPGAKAQIPSSEFAERFLPEPNTDEIHEFGFNVPTSCGSIPQSNGWSRDWVSFYARQRLDHAIRMILSDHGDRELNEQWSHLQLKIPRFFSDFEYKGSGRDEISAALLHGDLWSGNVAQLADGSRGVVYDPASFYGHSEYEFGIVRMFGGIPNEFERAYFEQKPKKKLFERRNKLYQLFHHLNHWNHFGSGYRPSSLRIMEDLNAWDS